MTPIADIIDDIIAEQCVIVIGPDIVDRGDKTFFEAMCDEIISAGGDQNLIDTTPQFIFANEELLQLSHPNKAVAVGRIMKRFYQQQTAFDKPLTQISQIPFHLIISLMPDDRLQRVFEAENLHFNHSHYPLQEAHPPIEKPGKEKPLIYNLLGNFNTNDHIITFDHLFEFLSGIMSEKGLPNNIQETLKKAQTFIFLGVHFEKWYVQLLLRIITNKTSKDSRNEKYSVLKNINNNEACTFIARRLEVDFLDTDPLLFLDKIYQECGKRNMLKTVNTKFKARIFISYCSIDKSIALKVEKKLKEGQIDVIRDEISTYAGQSIEQFINTINAVDAVFLIVSKDSLRSPWVSKEIITTLQANKRLIPCYIDKFFLDEKFWEELDNKIKESSVKITEKMVARGTDSIEDLIMERNDWIEMKRNMPAIRQELSRGICKPIGPDDFENSMAQVIDIF